MNIFKKVRIFGHELIRELKKSSWPSRAELKKSTIVVMIGIVILGFYVTIVDFSLFQVVSLLMACFR